MPDNVIPVAPQPLPKTNRVAVRGIDNTEATAFKLRWNNNQLELVGGANPKSVRLLIFFDPQQAGEKRLFVLPVIANSFELKDKGNGRFELKGKLRSFLPEANHQGRVEFKL